MPATVVRADAQTKNSPCRPCARSARCRVCGVTHVWCGGDPRLRQRLLVGSAHPPNRCSSVNASASFPPGRCGLPLLLPSGRMSSVAAAWYPPPAPCLATGELRSRDHDAANALSWRRSGPKRRRTPRASPSASPGPRPVEAWRDPARSRAAGPGPTSLPQLFGAESGRSGASRMPAPREGGATQQQPRVSDTDRGNRTLVRRPLSQQRSRPVTQAGRTPCRCRREPRAPEGSPFQSFSRHARRLPTIDLE